MQIRFGYRAEAEGHPPDELLKYAALAHKFGFDFIPISDHFHPWFHTNAACPFAWSWISAAAATIPNIRLGTIVTAPIGRYHPAVIAQAFATMDAMFPNRMFLALGTGEAMNDSPLGYPWPKFPERLERLKESLEIIRSLWASDFVNYSGEYYTLKDAKLYTKPKGRIPIYVAANGPQAASLVGKYADGYATVDPLMGNIKNLWPIIDGAAKEAGRDASQLTKNVELFFSYSQNYDEALASARKWKSALIPNILNLPIHDPRELERQGNEISDDELAKVWTITTEAEPIIKKAEDAIALGYDEIQLHSASPSEENFLQMCNRDVLPQLKQEFSST
ncbi:MAG: TIGR03557 family F420-dependent LLM class oxidoreductase [Candidatus Bathyarchaeia archaeon]|jgi:coenzyme F420-dependent glucose-6-phosphate dehydrogenase